MSDFWTRRQFIRNSSLAAAGLAYGLHADWSWAKEDLAALPPRDAIPPGETPVPRGDRPKQAKEVNVLYARARVPVSMVIDDSTCLVNLAPYSCAQFQEVSPITHNQDWRKWEREIPDAFVRKFHEWSAERGIKGKYSIVPYPACVGWVDRRMPGWSKQQLEDSLKLVRDLVMPNWDIHPELVTHTYGIDLKTGRPVPEQSLNSMENWGFADGKSADEVAAYIGYALKILKNAGLSCEGMTTPGGFGIHVLPALAMGTLEACRDVFQTEIPHYFRWNYSGDPKKNPYSVAPRVEHASGLDSADPKCVVSVITCAGDWFGGWTGDSLGSADRFIEPDLKTGRMCDIIARGEPAVMVGHWAGMYFNGQEKGFEIYKEVIRRLDLGYDNLLWMKLRELSRYCAAKELTAIERTPGKVALKAPFAAPKYTVRITDAKPDGAPTLVAGGTPTPLNEASKLLKLDSGMWFRDKQGVVVCFDLPKGESRISI